MKFGNSGAICPVLLHSFLLPAVAAKAAWYFEKVAAGAGFLILPFLTLLCVFLHAMTAYRLVIKIVA